MIHMWIILLIAYLASGLYFWFAMCGDSSIVELPIWGRLLAMVFITVCWLPILIWHSLSGGER